MEMIESIEKESPHFKVKVSFSATYDAQDEKWNDLPTITSSWIVNQAQNIQDISSDSLGS